MKTAMQLAIEHYEKLSLQGSNQAYVVANFLKENFLEMEKEQIIEAYETAMETDIYNEPLKIGKDYYNETYKSER
jgi:hypothetical protein